MFVYSQFVAIHNSLIYGILWEHNSLSFHFRVRQHIFVIYNSWSLQFRVHLINIIVYIKSIVCDIQLFNTFIWKLTQSTTSRARYVLYDGWLTDASSVCPSVQCLSRFVCGSVWHCRNVKVAEMSSIPSICVVIWCFNQVRPNIRKWTTWHICLIKFCGKTILYFIKWLNTIMGYY